MRPTILSAPLVELREFQAVKLRMRRERDQHFRCPVGYDDRGGHVLPSRWIARLRQVANGLQLISRHRRPGKDEIRAGLAYAQRHEIREREVREGEVADLLNGSRCA